MATMRDDRKQQMIRATFKAEEIDALGAILEEMCSCHESLYEVARGMHRIRDATREVKMGLRDLADAATRAPDKAMAGAALLLGTLEDADGIAEATRVEGDRILESSGALIMMIEALYRLLTHSVLMDLDAAATAGNLKMSEMMPIAS